MNLALIVRIVAVLLSLMAAFMLIPTVVALLYGETVLLSAFLLPIGVTFLGATVLFLLLRNAERELHPRDGFLLVALSWTSAAALGATPLWLSGAVPRYVDAFFEIMSG
ncbi:MAG: TrkH family potassium uptake protein, partial [Spirochaetaceae bacterium]